MFSEDTIHTWQVEQQEMELGRWCPEKHRRAFDPAQERLKKRNRREKPYRWDKEPKSYRTTHKARIRARYRDIPAADAFHPDKREYHTYGWEAF